MPQKIQRTHFTAQNVLAATLLDDFVKNGIFSDKNPERGRVERCGIDASGVHPLTQYFFAYRTKMARMLLPVRK